MDLQAKVCRKDHTTDLMQENYWGWEEQKLSQGGYMRDRDTDREREQEGQNKRLICDDDDVAAGGVAEGKLGELLISSAHSWH